MNQHEARELITTTKLQSLSAFKSQDQKTSSYIQDKTWFEIFQTIFLGSNALGKCFNSFHTQSNTFTPKWHPT